MADEPENPPPAEEEDLGPRLQSALGRIEELDNEAARLTSQRNDAARRFEQEKKHFEGLLAEKMEQLGQSEQAHMEEQRRHDDTLKQMRTDYEQFQREKAALEEQRKQALGDNT